MEMTYTDVEYRKSNVEVITLHAQVLFKTFIRALGFFQKVTKEKIYQQFSHFLWGSSVLIMTKIRSSHTDGRPVNEIRGI